MKNMLGILAILFLATQGMYAQEGAHTGKGTVAPPFVVMSQDSILDFGAMSVNTTASQPVRLENTGNVPLAIKDIYVVANNGDTIANIKIAWPRRPVKPGKKATVTITACTRGNTGSFNYDAFVVTEHSAAHRLLHITGAVIPSPERKEKEVETTGYFQFLTPVIKANTR